MNLDLRTYSTFNIGGTAHKVFEIKDIKDIEKIDSYSENMNKPLIIIGEGSNSIFAETTNKYIIGLMKLRGIKLISRTTNEVYVKVYGGEKWDYFVEWSVENKLSGVEALSGIPGTVGAAPIQNIGAYGSEISQTLVDVYVFNRAKKEFETLSSEQCLFAYRDSIFKQNPNQYIILYITLKLFTTPPLIPQYKDVQEYFKQNPCFCHSREGGNPGSQNSRICHPCTKTTPSAKEIRNAIIEIRNKKIPDYKKYPNCGSFFKNPIITKEHLERLKKTYPTIPYFETNDSKIKVYAGWLIEHIDYQSSQNKNIVFNQTNKLVLINQNNGTFDDLQLLLSRIKKIFQDNYDITLEPEPNIFI